jgi:hypothetical protein
MTTSPHTALIRIINEQSEKEKKQDIWESSPYKDLVKLQSNNVGNVGEMLINEICKESKIPALCDGSKTKKIGGGEGDGSIMDISIEIKTAAQGSKSNTFQHELGEMPWKAKKMIYIDISPECVYLTIFENFDEETYKSNKKLPSIFTTKTITWRKKKGAFKLDTTLKINEENILKGHTVKIKSDTPFVDIASFIKAKFN